MTITLTHEAEQELEQEAAQRNLTPEQMAAQAMLAGLRGQRTPQTLAELKPQRPIPPGRTFGELLAETPWPHDEPDLTDEEYNRLLEELS